MKYKIIIFAHIFIFVIFTILMAIAINRYVDRAARAEHTATTELIQKRVDDTIAILDRLVNDPFILSKDNSYGEKAIYLTNYNIENNLGYMMIRILDEDINVYREGNEHPVSNLSTRDYMQALYTTGQMQITDVFLAGADGKTRNYTIAMPIKEGDEVVGCIFVAVLDADFSEYLIDNKCQNILIGSLLQYMSGIPDEEFGKSLTQTADSEIISTKSIKKIEEDFNNKQGGTFWTIGLDAQYYIYTPIQHTDWATLSIINVYPLITPFIILYFIVVVLCIVSYRLFMYYARKGYFGKDKEETTGNKEGLGD